MQALAVSLQLALFGRFATPYDEIPLAVFPAETLLTALFYPSALVVVGSRFGPPLPLHLPLEAANRCCLGSQFGT